MANHPDQQPDTGPRRADRYVAGYSPATIQHYTRRTVARQAAFFLPHLRAGMTLLDCGCGPGTVTIGLAQFVAPGLVLGIDIEPRVVARARVLGREQGVSTVHFHVASGFALPFAEGSFDAVFAHTLLQHLSRPISALEEMGRVLKSGGVIGLRNVDHGGRIIVPANQGLEAFYDLHERIWTHHGSDLRLGRHLRSLLRQVGFIRIAGSASYDYAGTLAETRALALLQMARMKSTASFIGAGCLESRMQTTSVSTTPGWWTRGIWVRCCAPCRVSAMIAGVWWIKMVTASIGWSGLSVIRLRQRRSCLKLLCYGCRASLNCLMFHGRSSIPAQSREGLSDWIGVLRR